MSMFRCKQFDLRHDRSAWKLGTDSILLGSWVRLGEETRALDVGTGSGILALMLAQRHSSLIIDAVEPHSGSCQDASENFKNSPWNDRLALYRGNLHRVSFAASQAPGKYDLIVSNPPFYEGEPHSGSCQDASENFKNSPWNDRLALYRGNLQSFAASQAPGKYDLIVSNPPFYEGDLRPASSNRSLARHSTDLRHLDLLEIAGQLLSPGGRIALVLPAREGERLLKEVGEAGFYCNRICEVQATLNKPVSRLLMEFCERKEQREREHLLVEGEHGLTAAFTSLTEAFYL